ncbi:hypothetical protein V8F33_004694 [Rhypophila sp. PSN 637]
MYDPSQTRYRAGGLEAQDTQKFASSEPFDRDKFRDMVLNHIDWEYRGKSPFISLLPDPRGAINWGRKLELRTEKDWRLVEIETAELLCFKVVDVLARRLRAVLPETEYSYFFKFEYLCLHQVPSEAIIQSFPNAIIPSSNDDIPPWVQNNCKQQPQPTPWSTKLHSSNIQYSRKHATPKHVLNMLAKLSI